MRPIYKPNAEGMVMKEKTNTRQKFTSVLAAVFPLLYGVMYLPIWNGKELQIYNTVNLFTLLFQGVCFIIAAVRVKNIFLNKVSFNFIDYLIMPVSILLLCFVGFFFIENLLGIPPIPPQH